MRRMALFPGRDSWTQARKAVGMVTDNHEDMHGGELETSILLHYAPDVVRQGFDDEDHVASDRPHLLTRGMTSYTESGLIGAAVAGHCREGRACAGRACGGFRAVPASARDLNSCTPDEPARTWHPGRRL